MFPTTILTSHSHYSQHFYIYLVSQTLYHDVHKHIVHGAIFRVNCAIYEVVSDEGKLNIDIFHFYIMCGVFGECYGTLIIVEKDHEYALGRPEVLEKVLWPNHFIYCLLGPSFNYQKEKRPETQFQTRSIGISEQGREVTNLEMMNMLEICYC